MTKKYLLIIIVALASSPIFAQFAKGDFITGGRISVIQPKAVDNVIDISAIGGYFMMNRLVVGSEMRYLDVFPSQNASYFAVMPFARIYPINKRIQLFGEIGGSFGFGEKNWVRSLGDTRRPTSSIGIGYMIFERVIVEAVYALSYYDFGSNWVSDKDLNINFLIKL